MKAIVIGLLAAFALTTPTFAHPDHEPEDDGPVVKTIPDHARDAIVRLVSRAALDPRWISQNPVSTEPRSKDGQRQWVVFYEDRQIADTAKNKLYAVVTDSGGYVSHGHVIPPL